MIKKLIHFCLHNSVIAFSVAIILIIAGLMVSPFDFNTGLPRDPVPVDAIPNIGENQQIVFTSWPGRSPQDVEDQLTYPLTVKLLGVPGVKTVRSSSMFGFSTISVVFEDKIDFYWARSRLAERLLSIKNILPDGVQPVLGPDATPLGQVYWYTLEGEGFDLYELRSIQDFTVKYALQSVPGISEVSSIGGYVKEYQIDVDPEALKAYGVTLADVVKAVKNSNLDVGANTIEVNKVEYLIRSLGFVKSIDDLKNAVIKSVDGVPITLGRVGRIKIGPATRRGALDKEGAPAVGGVAVVRYGANPLEVINALKKKIAQIAPGLPSKKLKNGKISRVKIVPFYDRTNLIHETLGTLRDALTQQILLTILVVLIMLMHLPSGMLISSLLPMAVLLSFLLMKIFGVDSNLMSLGGIAIAIGTMVDMGIVLCENILRHMNERSEKTSVFECVYTAASEVGSAVMTAVSTTIVSFLAVFTMVGSEGKLFKPLAFTKTFALISALLISLTLIPPLAYYLFPAKVKNKKNRRPNLYKWLTVVIGLVLCILGNWKLGFLTLVGGISSFFWKRVPEKIRNGIHKYSKWLLVVLVMIVLATEWHPIGVSAGLIANFFFVAFVALFVIGGLLLFKSFYVPLLKWFLAHKKIFIIAPALVLFSGLLAWLGFGRVFSFIPYSWNKIGGSKKTITKLGIWKYCESVFPGLGREFMPPLDEGSYLFMPTTMPHASIGAALDILKKQDIAINAIPEVKEVVGKIGRVDSALDPAPLSMIETMISYYPEYSDPDPKTGKRKRLWRPHIKKPDDIWKEIVKASLITGSTMAPRLQPMSARIVMLQTGIRAPMGVKIQGNTLLDVEKLGMDIEKLLKQVPGIEPAAVIADRVIGKPYLEIKINRREVARYGIQIKNIQNAIEVAIGGKPLSRTVEGRESYAIRIRYARERRQTPDSMKDILIPAPDGAQIPLGQLARINFVRGPQVIKGEDSFKVSYVVFDKKPGVGETDLVERARAFLNAKVKTGELNLPAGSRFSFVGTYENQVRAEKTLKVVLPLSLLLIALILYLEFKRISTTLLVFSGIAIAWSGGFIVIWLFSKSWFMNFSLLGIDIRSLFNMHSMNLSVAVWVGFIALFGIASDDGVVMATYLEQVFAENKPDTVEKIRESIVTAGGMRILPCLMTTATTILALLPILTSAGRGADVMIPMAIPSFGGMCVELLTLFVVPVCYCWLREKELEKEAAD